MREHPGIPPGTQKLVANLVKPANTMHHRLDARQCPGQKAKTKTNRAAIPIQFLVKPGAGTAWARTNVGNSISTRSTALFKKLGQCTKHPRKTITACNTGRRIKKVIQGLLVRPAMRLSIMGMLTNTNSAVIDKAPIMLHHKSGFAASAKR